MSNAPTKPAQPGDIKVPVGSPLFVRQRAEIERLRKFAEEHKESLS